MHLLPIVRGLGSGSRHLLFFSVPVRRFSCDSRLLVYWQGHESYDCFQTLLPTMLQPEPVRSPRSGLPLKSFKMPLESLPIYQRVGLPPTHFGSQASAVSPHCLPIYQRAGLFPTHFGSQASVVSPRRLQRAGLLPAHGGSQASVVSPRHFCIFSSSPLSSESLQKAFERCFEGLLKAFQRLQKGF
jgi:hypothetical protein